jgi:hypothetical protein
MLALVIVGLTLLLVAAVSRPLSSTPITLAMVVVVVGVLAGPLVLDDLTVRPTSSTVRRLAEATLAVVLFSDSSRGPAGAAARGFDACPLLGAGVALPNTYWDHLGEFGRQGMQGHLPECEPAG